MKKITIKKIEIEALEVLQDEIGKYQRVVISQMDWLTGIIIHSISFRLWLLLRTKLESGRNIFTISFRPDEAATILACCLNATPHPDIYRQAILERIKSSIDQQLKSM